MALTRSLLSPFSLSQVTGTGPREGGRLLLFRRRRPSSSSPSTAAAVVSRVVVTNNNRRFVRAAAAEEEGGGGGGQMEKRDEERQQRARLSAPMLLKRVLSGDPYGERPRSPRCFFFFSFFFSFFFFSLFRYKITEREIQNLFFFFFILHHTDRYARPATPRRTRVVGYVPQRPVLRRRGPHHVVFSG